jgi:hypothetical protein
LHDLGKGVNGEQGVGIYRREFSVPAHSRTEKMLVEAAAPNPANGARCAPFFKPLPRLLLPSGKLYFVRIFPLLIVVGDALRSVAGDAE